ncbi:hypothetical protein F5Y03DRAFT_361360, partial [Xylaria venustula]
MATSRPVLLITFLSTYPRQSFFFHPFFFYFSAYFSFPISCPPLSLPSTSTKVKICLQCLRIENKMVASTSKDSYDGFTHRYQAIHVFLSLFHISVLLMLLIDTSHHSLCVPLLFPLYFFFLSPCNIKNALDKIALGLGLSPSTRTGIEIGWLAGWCWLGVYGG